MLAELTSVDVAYPPYPFVEEYGISEKREVGSTPRQLRIAAMGRWVSDAPE